MSEKMSVPDDEYDDPPFICPRTKEPCVRAFCEDYGCADQARVPIDEYDVERGSVSLDEIAPRIPRKRRKRPNPIL